MFAVIKTGGKQYRVAAEDVLKIEKVAGEVGDIVEIGQVLAHGEGDKVTFGAPFVSGASVAAEVVAQGKSGTVIAFKKRRRQNSRRKIGHRQLLTTVRISEILLDGAKPSKKTVAKPAKAGVTAEAPAKTADAGKTEASKPDVGKTDTGKTDASKEPSKAKEAAKAKSDEGKVETKAEPKAKQPKADAAPLFKAAKGEPDDLTVIKGIGPVAAKDLAAEGITTFAQLAALTDAEIETIDAHMPFSAHQIQDWREQAKALAKK